MVETNKSPNETKRAPLIFALFSATSFDSDKREISRKQKMKARNIHKVIWESFPDPQSKLVRLNPKPLANVWWLRHAYC